MLRRVRDFWMGFISFMFGIEECFVCGAIRTREHTFLVYEGKFTCQEGDCYQKALQE